ncbi:MAG: flagellin FliC [Granulosicoccus sp.]|nr:flagellin FliC [Granulosicoccus sp.]
MALSINTNIMSLNAQRNLNSSQNSLATSVERLSSGMRVNSARDDAAGLAISQRMESQIRGSNQAIRNANDGISLAQAAEGALNEVGNMLQRMRELAVQSANGSNSTSDRQSLDAEYSALDDEITRLASGTEFNGANILAGDAGANVFQVGANVGDTLTITTSAVTAVGGDILSTTGSTAAITAIDTKIDAIAADRATYGAASSRFSSAINNLQVNVETTSAAQGRIMDADFAIETANMTRASILQQAGTAMIAQANALPQNVLSLLR